MYIPVTSVLIETMMQNRNSSGTQRVLLLVGIVAILIVGVLYFMKRVEANRLATSLETLEVNVKSE